MKNRFDNAWGSIGLVYSEISAYTVLFDMMEESNYSSEFSHIINLSINDFPTRPIDDLSSFLHSPENLNTNFLDEDFPRYGRLNKTYLDCDRSLAFVNFDKRNGIDICGSAQDLENSINRTKYAEGSQWHFLTRKFAQYLISDFKPIERLLSMKFSFIPDESYFQIVKSEWNDSMEMNWNRWNYRYIPWNKGRLEVSREDVPLIQSMRNGELKTYFARKVYSNNVRRLIIKEYLSK
eukprot:gene8611-10600_t